MGVKKTGRPGRTRASRAAKILTPPSAQQDIRQPSPTPTSSLEVIQLVAHETDIADARKARPPPAKPKASLLQKATPDLNHGRNPIWTMLYPDTMDEKLGTLPCKYDFTTSAKKYTDALINSEEEPGCWEWRKIQQQEGLSQATQKFMIFWGELVEETASYTHAVLAYRSAIKCCILAAITTGDPDLLPGEWAARTLYKIMHMDNRFDAGNDPYIEPPYWNSAKAIKTIQSHGWNYSLTAHDLKLEWENREQMLMWMPRMSAKFEEKMADKDLSYPHGELPRDSPASTLMARLIGRGLPGSMAKGFLEEFPDSFTGKAVEEGIKASHEASAERASEGEYDTIDEAVFDSFPSGENSSHTISGGVGRSTGDTNMSQ